MFDVGFWELILIAIISLIILGPERLPVAIRTVRDWIAGARKLSETVKTELTEELRVHELHANLKKAEQSNLQNLSPEVSESLKTLQDAAASVSEPYKKTDTDLVDSKNSLSLANTTSKAEQFEGLAANQDMPSKESSIASVEVLEPSIDKIKDKP
jgi:sec-independent protein translocase protein TatB